eukprot:1492620-Pleurochrysis_carterae.AAC.1
MIWVLEVNNLGDTHEFMTGSIGRSEWHATSGGWGGVLAAQSRASGDRRAMRCLVEQRRRQLAQPSRVGGLANGLRVRG